MADPEMIPSATSAEIASSLASLWEEYTGKRPTELHVSIQGNRVTCVVEDAVSALDESLAPVEGSGHSEAQHSRTRAGFKREAAAAVQRVSGRRVMAFVSDHDAQTDIATERLILESPPPRGQALAADRVPLM